MWIGDERKHLHRGATAVAAKSIHLADLGQQSCPDSRRFLRNGGRPRGCAGLPGGDGLVRGILGNLADVESAVLQVLPLTSLGRATAPPLGGQAHQVGPRVGQMLQELDQELQNGEELHVCLEVRIVLRAVRDACFMFLHEHLAEGDRGRAIYWARASRVLEEAAGPPAGLRPAAGRGILTDSSTLKPLWVQPSMPLASRSLMSERWRKNATMAANKYRASLARSRVGI